VVPPSEPEPSARVVALDARLIGYAAGIARYAVGLGTALARLEDGPSYVILRGRRGGDVVLDGAAVRSRRCLTPPHHRLERWTLPLEILSRRPTPGLLHSVDHVAPAWGPWRSVVTVHDLAFLLSPETHTPASRAYYAAAGESLRRAHRVIAVSQRTAADATRLLGLDPARLRVVHEAVGAGFRPRPAEALAAVAARHQVDPARPYLLVVGTLEPRKNVPLALETLALLRRRLDVQLLIVGARGDSDGDVFQAAARTGVGDAARFLGRVPDEELAVLYSHAGVFLFPSLYEGFGLPPLEAMACGAPVVSSDAGPMPEVLGDAAVLLPPHDPERWAAAVERVLGDGRLAASLRQRGFARAALFSWEQAARATRAVYREALLG
jgi:glycosyltransferase involved in cell wall biosynthesis